MLKFKIHGENIEVTEAMRDAIVTKLSVLGKYTDKETMVKVNVKTYPYKDKKKVEVTIPFKETLHAKDTSEDLYASIDQVVEKLDRQCRKMKTKTLKQKQERKPLKSLFQPEYVK